MKKDKRYLHIYKQLLKLHGPQGWWPIQGKYNPENYNIPKNTHELFEICIGAILTQNTAWPNVEQALQNLKKSKLLSATKISRSNLNVLKKCIRPSGYFNQKSKKLKIFSDFFINLKGNTPTRKELLKVWGIGPETADSILLYGYHQNHFVVDAYTKRMFTHLKLINESLKYEEIKKLFEMNLPKENIIYNEYHALIVNHCKMYYSKKPYGKKCPIEINLLK